jgi:hypothetical protein
VQPGTEDPVEYVGADQGEGAPEGGLLSLWGSNTRIRLWPAASRNSAWLSGGDLVQVDEAVEDLFAADPVLGEIDLRWPDVTMSRWRLA